jgi:hypothetical protein
MVTNQPLELARTLPKVMDFKRLSKTVTAEDQKMVERTIREWTYDHASASESGDYCEVLFEKSEDNDDFYVLIQSQYEFHQACDVIVETDAGEWFAELVVERATLDQQRLLIDGSDKEKAVRIIVYYSADDGTYADLMHVLKIMLPDIDVRPNPNRPD